MDFTFVKFITQLLSSADDSLENETRLLLLWVGSLVTLCTFVFTHITSMVKPVHIFMARSRASKSCLKTELCFHRYVHFPVFRYIFLIFTTSSVLATRMTSLLWSSLLTCIKSRITQNGQELIKNLYKRASFLVTLNICSKKFFVLYIKLDKSKASSRTLVRRSIEALSCSNFFISCLSY